MRHVILPNMDSIPDCTWRWCLSANYSVGNSKRLFFGLIFYVLALDGMKLTYRKWIIDTSTDSVGGGSPPCDAIWSVGRCLTCDVRLAKVMQRLVIKKWLLVLLSYSLDRYGTCRIWLQINSVFVRQRRQGRVVDDYLGPGIFRQLLKHIIVLVKEHLDGNT